MRRAVFVLVIAAVGAAGYGLGRWEKQSTQVGTATPWSEGADDVLRRLDRSVEALESLVHTERPSEPATGTSLDVTRLSTAPNDDALNQIVEELRALHETLENKAAISVMTLYGASRRKPEPDIEALLDLWNTRGDDPSLPESLKGMSYLDAVLAFGTPTRKVQANSADPPTFFWEWDLPNLPKFFLQFLRGEAQNGGFARP